MTKNIVVDRVTITPDWFKKYSGIHSEIDRQLMVGLAEPGKGITLEQLQMVVEHKNPFAGLDEIRSWIDWVFLYQDCFNLDLSVLKLTIPTYQPNTWFVPVHESLTEQQIFDACAKHFSCNGSDFSSVRDLHRTGTTVRRFKANVEADDEYQNKSANYLQQEGLEERAITLKERMLLELWYFRTTGKHLDLNYQTLCNGSRSVIGGVVAAFWDSGDLRFFLRWCNPSYRHDGLRSRVAVS